MNFCSKAIVTLLLGSALGTAQSLPVPEVLDLAETAALLRVKPEVVRALAEAQGIPVRRVGDVWRFSRAAVLEWLAGDRAEALRGAAAPPSPAEAPVAPKRELAAAPPPVVGEHPASPTTEEIALRDQRVLVKRGSGTIDIDLAYAHGEQTLIPVARVEQGAVGASATVRYGLKNDLQLTTRLPMVWRRSATFTDASVSGTNAPYVQHGRFAGDASVSLMGIASREAAGTPTLIWSLDSVVPTGPGDRGVGGGLVVSKSYDPAVLFAGVSYLYGVSIHPADRHASLARQNFGAQVGYTYAVNDNLALNSVLVGSYRNLRAADQTSIRPSRETYGLQLGMTWLLAHNLFLEPGLGLRLGGEPGVTISMNVSRPFRWLKKR